MALNEALGVLEHATRAGASFVFGYLGGGAAPFAVSDPASSFVLAFRALPLILVVSALSSLLFYWRVLPWLVRAVSHLLRKTLGIGGAVGLSAAADIFVGMVEAPLFVRPYLAAMSRGELFSVMTCGMATVAGTVMALYASFLAPVVPDAMGHILTASLVSTPGALLIAALMVPAGEASTAGELKAPDSARSSMEAITQGALAGGRCSSTGPPLSVISRHLRNVFKEGELERGGTVAKNATVQKEGGREVLREIEYFNLDSSVDRSLIFENPHGCRRLRLRRGSPFG